MEILGYIKKNSNNTYTAFCTFFKDYSAKGSSIEWAKFNLKEKLKQINCKATIIWKQ